MRGELPVGYFKQNILTLNPWFEGHWINERFFKNKPTDQIELATEGRTFHVIDDECLAMTTNYLVNEFLGDDDRRVFQRMKMHTPKRYEIEGLGNWGIAEGTVFNNWEELNFDFREIAGTKGFEFAFGLDFGFTHDPTAFICSLYNLNTKELFIFDEHYQQGMLNIDIAAMIQAKNYHKAYIVADRAEQKSIAEIRRLGIRRMVESKKGPDSVRQGIQFLQQFKIYIHPSCVNAKLEFSNYIWKNDKTGKATNEPVDKWNHLIDGLRYSLELAKNTDKNAKYIGS